MNFDLSEEHEAIVETVADLLSQELDGAARVAALSDDSDHDQKLWRLLIACGAAGIVVSESYGGSGLGLLEASLIAQEIGRAAAAVPYWGHTLACLAISTYGSEQQRERWLPAMAAGELLATTAFAEPGGWPPSAWALAAGIEINGVKTYVPNAAAADLIVVGLQDHMLAVVEKGAAVAYRHISEIDPTRSLYDVTLFGATSVALKGAHADLLYDAGLVLVAADAFGGAEACLDRTIAYAHTRYQYGVPIGSFQAVKHQLADLAVELEQSRALWWYAAHAWDADRHDRGRAALLAKSHLCDRFVKTARSSVELHGGIGFTWEYDLHVWLRRAYADAAFLGDPRLLRALLSDDLASVWGPA